MSAYFPYDHYRASPRDCTVHEREARAAALRTAREGHDSETFVHECWRRAALALEFREGMEAALQVVRDAPFGSLPKIFALQVARRFLRREGDETIWARTIHMLIADCKELPNVGHGDARWRKRRANDFLPEERLRHAVWLWAAAIPKSKLESLNSTRIYGLAEDGIHFELPLRSAGRVLFFEEPEKKHSFRPGPSVTCYLPRVP